MGWLNFSGERAPGQIFYVTAACASHTAHNILEQLFSSADEPQLMLTAGPGMMPGAGMMAPGMMAPGMMAPGMMPGGFQPSFGQM